MKKNFAIQKTFVVLHPTTKQKNNMNTQTNNQTSAKEKFLFALLFVVPAIAAALIEILNA